MLVRYRVGWTYLFLLIIIFVGLAARVYQIGYNFDTDEIFSIKIASKTFGEVISGSLMDTPHPPLYNILLHLWIKVFGVSEISTRLLSILLSSGFLLVSYVFLLRLVSGYIALGMLSIFALSPLFVSLGQQVRLNSLIIFLSIVNLFAFTNILRVFQSHRWVLIWAVSSVFLIYTQYMAALLFAFEIGIALFYLRSASFKMLRYIAVAGALILPWLIAAMGDKILLRTDPLPQLSWQKPPTPVDLLWFYVSVFGEVPGMQTRWLLVLLAIAVGGYAWYLLVSRKLPAVHSLMFVLAFALPTLVFAISLLGSKNFFAPRQMVGAAIAFVGVIGLCLAILPRMLSAAILVGLVVWTVSGLPDAFPQNKKPPWRFVAEQIDREYGSVVLVAQEKWVSEPLAYYRKRGAIRLLNADSEAEESERFLFVCRPYRCSLVESEAIKSRVSLLHTYRWGRLKGATEFNQLYLYEIHSADQSKCSF